MRRIVSRGAAKRKTAWTRRNGDSTKRSEGHHAFDCEPHPRFQPCQTGNRSKNPDDNLPIAVISPPTSCASAARRFSPKERLALWRSQRSGLHVNGVRYRRKVELKKRNRSFTRQARYFVGGLYTLVLPRDPEELEKADFKQIANTFLIETYTVFWTVHPTCLRTWHTYSLSRPTASI